MEWITGSLRDFSPADARDVSRNLSETRKKRIDSFKRPDDRLRSLLGEYLVKKLLGSAYGIEDPIIECTENGRPFLKDVPLFISISHSGDMVACAVSDQPVGIDVEKLKPIRSGLIDRVCLEAEKEYVLKDAGSTVGVVTDEGIVRRFFEIWTGKEAYFKSRGTGITDFKAVNVLTLERRVISLGEYLVQII